MVIPVIIMMMILVSERIKHIQANAEAALGNYMTGIEEMAGGMRTVKIASQEPSEKSRMQKAARDIRSLSIRLQAAQALVLPSIDFSSAFVYVLVIGGRGVHGAARRVCPRQRRRHHLPAWPRAAFRSGQDGCAVLRAASGKPDSARRRALSFRERRRSRMPPMPSKSLIGKVISSCGTSLSAIRQERRFSRIST